MSRGAQKRLGCPWEGSDPSPLLAFGSHLVLGVLLAFGKHTALSSREWEGRPPRGAGLANTGAMPVGAGNPTPKCSLWKLFRFLGARRLKPALVAVARTSLLGAQAGPRLLCWSCQESPSFFLSLFSCPLVLNCNPHPDKNDDDI